MVYFEDKVDVLSPLLTDSIWGSLILGVKCIDKTWTNGLYHFLKRSKTTIIN